MTKEDILNCGANYTLSKALLEQSKDKQQLLGTIETHLANQLAYFFRKNNLIKYVQHEQTEEDEKAGAIRFTAEINVLKNKEDK